MTVILTTAEIEAKFNVTSAQMDKAHRILNERTGEIFYQVESQSIDAVYTVRAHQGGHKLTCTCPAGNPPRDAWGMPLSPILPCWHKRAARAVSFEHRQNENLAARKEAEAAARQAEELAERLRCQAQDEAAARQRLALNGNRPFTLEKTEAQRGYDIRIQRAGSTWQNEKAHGWAPAGQLPAEWTAITEDPTVISAVYFPSTQRNWQAQKRKNVATFTREAVTA